MYLSICRTAGEEPTKAAGSNEESQTGLDLRTDNAPGERIHATSLCCSLERLTEMCRPLQGVELATLGPDDTIVVRTVNSEYRISAFDPKTGRALLEGGSRPGERVEARVIGSSFGGTALWTGWLFVGLRMEACSNDKYIRTSPIQSISIEHEVFPEPTPCEVKHWQN